VLERPRSSARLRVVDPVNDDLREVMTGAPMVEGVLPPADFGMWEHSHPSEVPSCEGRQSGAAAGDLPPIQSFQVLRVTIPVGR
jgi:hypothetical protein